VLVVVWSLVIANVVATFVMMLISRQAVKLSRLDPRVLVPFILIVIFMAAYQNSRRWTDIVMVVVIGIAAWFLKHAGWPRPPILVGFVLGVPAERYLGISYGRYGFEWLERPLVITLGVLIVVVILFGILQTARRTPTTTAEVPRQRAAQPDKEPDNAS
jgi:putative tricarboxylic transport membrane protein